MADENTGAAASHYKRVNVLIATALLMVILILAVTVWYTITNEFVKGIITLVLGRFLGYVDQIYNYEFGTTRASASKDQTINALSNAAATTAAIPQGPVTPTAPAVNINTPSAQVTTGTGDVTVSNDGVKQP